ncbi:serine hydrolase [Streptomyces sp. NPDC001941]|uniref:serine hydrolase n=1 Tax=Streptomyces sp. NPDC001941 TaxID=3154659 RepID=UPI003329EA22
MPGLPAATAPAAAAAPAVSCVSTTPGLAAKLTTDITAALKGRTPSISLALYDRKTGTSCSYRATVKYDSASVVKATVLGALLLDAQKHKRSLTSTEKSLATAMITKSDNNATSKLWKQLGVAKVKTFLTAAGMTQTVPGADGYWGLTQITSRDESVLLGRLITPTGLFTEANRQYQLTLMRAVVKDQRWGTPAGAPADVAVQVKNGWLSRATHGWRVHSIGAFTGYKGRPPYHLNVLTQDNRTMNDGVNAIQAIARVVHRDLNPTAAPQQAFVPPAAPQGALPATPETAAVPLVTAPATGS